MGAGQRNSSMFTNLFSSWYSSVGQTLSSFYPTGPAIGIQSQMLAEKKAAKAKKLASRNPSCIARSRDHACQTVAPLTITAVPTATLLIETFLGNSANRHRE